MIKAKSYNYGKKKEWFGLNIPSIDTSFISKQFSMLHEYIYNNLLGINKRLQNKSSTQTQSTNTYKSSYSNKDWFISKNRLYLLWFFVLIPFTIWFWLFYIYILKDLPDLSSIEVINSIPQSINIADRNWKILYKYSPIENREYVSYDEISENMINAIVAVEDQNFRNHWGIDVQWIIRAGIKDLLYNKSEWASTITQQLIKNLFLTNEKKMTRKLKEITLAIKLDNLINSQINKLYPNASEEENQKEAKKRIVEMYLNYIFLWNNSYWVQSASHVYFWTSAKNLDILQSAIISTLPKAPSTYDPYKNRDLVMWKITATDSEWWKIEITWDIKNSLKIKVYDLLTNNNEKFSRSNSSFRSFVVWLLSFDFEYWSWIYKISYNEWRKDISLERMYVEWYIDESQIKNAFFEWLFDFKFEKQRVKIDSPHFVYYVLDLIKQQNNWYIWDYTEEMIEKWWFTIITTLDSNIQKMAEDSVANSMKTINWYWANNTALIHLDSINWDVLAYIWSTDFYNDQINWQVDILRSKQQPWSTIKPLVYTLWFMSLPLTLDTDIYDIEFKMWSYSPNNFDDKFMWPMPLRKSLAYSRNIPAIKMFLSIWWEELFIPFLKSLWVTSIIPPKWWFWASMAIWSAEMTPLDLAKAYTHLSAMWKPWKLDPIMEIKKFDDTILYKRQNEKAEQIVPSGVAYLLWNILSDPKNLPSDWIREFNFPIKFAWKTWTTNKEANAKWVKYPKDGWMVAYTPSKVTVFWAGNTNDQALRINAFWWWMNNQTWRLFWWKLLKAWLIINEIPTDVETKEVTISRLSGKLATKNTPSKYVVTSMWYINKLPTEFDDAANTIQIDNLCNGKVSELTPASDIISSYIVKPATFMPNKNDLADIAKYLWFRQKKYYWGTWSKLDWSYDDVFSAEPTQVCEERYLEITETWWNEQDMIDNIATTWNNYSWTITTWEKKKDMQLSILKPTNNAKVYKEFALWFNIKWSNLPINVTVNIDWQNIWNYSYNKSNVTDIKNISIDWDSKKSFEVSVSSTDSNNQTITKSIKVNVWDTDKNPPYIIKNKTTVKNSWEWSYSINLLFSDQESKVKWWSIYDSKWTKITDFNWNLASFDTTEATMLKYEITDWVWNTAKWDFNISSYTKIQ